ncbi:hypothetical protein ES705_18319 [subsurface metagenome]
MKEYETTKLAKKELKNMSIEIVELRSKVGVLGIVQGNKKGKDRVTTFRADMDALPIGVTVLTQFALSRNL